MTDAGDPSAAPPPPHPGWYADAHGAWWWWDGAGWTPAPTGAPGGMPAGEDGRRPERTQALVMWIVFLVGGGWIAALIFHLVSREKPFVRHHSAEALNLTIVLLPLQLVGLALLVPGMVTWVQEVIDAADAGSSETPPLNGLLLLGFGVSFLLSLVTYGVGIAGVVQASRGRWWRAPLPWHPVRGVVAEGEEPYSVV